jgi:hypothetical protein
MNRQDPKYQQKSKSLSSPEQNYFTLFAMRYPVKGLTSALMAKSISGLLLSMVLTFALKVLYLNSY